MATNPKGSSFTGHRWKPFDVALLDSVAGHPLSGSRVKVHAVLRGGREVHIRYHKPGVPDQIVHSSRLRPLPSNHQP